MKNFLFRPYYISFLIIIFLTTLPSFIGEYYLHVAYYSIWFIYICLAFNISVMTGMFSVAHATFIAFGAYVPVMLFLKLGISPWLGMPVGMICAGISAIIVGYAPFRFGMPRLSFAIYTLGLSFISYHIVLGSRWLGADWGLSLFFKDDSLLNFQWLSKVPYYYILLIFTIGIGVINWLIVKSKLGLYFKAIKDNERAAAAAGVNIIRYKLTAFVISAFLIAPAGVFWAMYARFTDAESLASPHLCIKLLLYTSVGGAGTIWGPIIGAAAFAPLTEIVRGILGSRYAGADMIVIGIVIIIMLTFMRSGIVEWLDKQRQRSGVIPENHALESGENELVSEKSSLSYPSEASISG